MYGFTYRAERTNLQFDHPSLITSGGVEPLMRLAEAAGLMDQTRVWLRVSGGMGANADVKVATIVAGMAMGGDCIDDMNLMT